MSARYRDHAKREMREDICVDIYNSYPWWIKRCLVCDKVHPSTHVKKSLRQKGHNPYSCKNPR